MSMTYSTMNLSSESSIMQIIPMERVEMENERLMWLLDNWSEYMHTPSSKLGYPSKSMCMSSGGASGSDEFEIMCQTADIHCAKALDSIIDSISHPQRTAVNHVWLKVSHHYPTQELDILEAYENIIKLCVKRGLA